jgi:hypothetical protein
MPVYPLIGGRSSLADLIASLDSSLDVFSLPPSRVQRDYQKRYVLQKFVQENIEHKSIALCRRGYRVIDAEGVATRVACSNSWLCPVCAPRKLNEFVTKSSTIIESSASVLAFTLTQEQETGEALADSLNRLTKTIAATTSGRAWADLKSTYGIIGMGYVVELKHSPTGWHPHAHGFLVSTRDLTQEQGSRLGLAVRRRWVQQSTGASLAGQHAALLDPAEYYSSTRYLAKDHPRYTTSNMVNRTIGDLVHDASRGDLDALDLLHEVGSATVRRRRFSWTPGILDTLQDVAHAPLSA